MAGTDKRDWEDLNITREEVENLKEALKKDEFRKLLTEYAEEITCPENRKQYQEEIIQLEAERGVDCTFVNPEPGFVVKTSVDGKKKAFINICQNNAIGRPSSKPVIKENSKGLSWSIPFSQAPGREDHDKKRNRCIVYDVVFHPNTLHLANKSSQFQKLVVDTALSAVEDSYKVKLDKKNLKYPKLKYKGIPVATVIRKLSKKQPSLTEDDIEFQKNLNYPAPPPVGDKKPVVRNYENVKEDKGKYTFPKYIVKHRTGIDLQEYTYDKKCKLNTAIPKELVIEVNLPLLNSTKEVTLDVMEKSVHLICEKPAKYKLDIQLPYAVNAEEGNAKFDKDERVLVITLPVIKAKKTIADLLREDSGVESDFERCTSCDDSSPVGSISNEDEKSDECSSTSPPLILHCEGLPKTSDVENKTAEQFRTKQELNFLDNDKQYLLPSFKCNVDNNNLCFVLNVKNVDPTSVQKEMKAPDGCHIKFLSLGTGFYPVFYAFLIKFQNVSTIKDVSIDVWDNNVTVLVEVGSLITTYEVGIDENSLVKKDLTNALQLEKKMEKLKVESTTESIDVSDDNNDNNNNDNNNNDDDDDDNDDDDKSIDCCVNENVSVTVESADVDEITIEISQKEENKVKFGGKKKPHGSKVGLAPTTDKKVRTFSESSTDEVVALSPITRKSILKNRICRSLSESNAEDYAFGSSIEASEGSDLCIPEESEESHAIKKTVRFNDRICKQIFRANSSILGRKKKNQKRSRNKRKMQERRTSESENSECEEKEREKRTNALIQEIDGRNKENNSNNCDIAETVISEENETGSEDDKSEVRFKAKKDDKIFEFKSDLIFDLDM